VLHRTLRECEPPENSERSAKLLEDLGQRPLLHPDKPMLSWNLLMLGRLHEAARAYQAGAAGSHEVEDRRSEAVAVAGGAPPGRAGPGGVASIPERVEEGGGFSRTPWSAG